MTGTSGCYSEKYWWRKDERVWVGVEIAIDIDVDIGTAVDFGGGYVEFGGGEVDFDGGHFLE